MDMVTWECDYPHSDSTWPQSPEMLSRSRRPASPTTTSTRSRHLNAMRHFNYDPFSVLGGKENCTVGALREQVAGRDVAIRSQKRQGDQKGSVNAAELVKMAASAGK